MTQPKDIFIHPIDGPIRITVCGFIVDTDMVEDAVNFRYLVEAADPGQLVRMLNGSRTLSEWRAALADMRSKP